MKLVQTRGHRHTEGSSTGGGEEEEGGSGDTEQDTGHSGDRDEAEPKQTPLPLPYLAAGGVAALALAVALLGCALWRRRRWKCQLCGGGARARDRRWNHTPQWTHTPHAEHQDYFDPRLEEYIPAEGTGSSSSSEASEEVDYIHPNDREYISINSQRASTRLSN